MMTALYFHWLHSLCRCETGSKCLFCSWLNGTCVGTFAGEIDADIDVTTPFLQNLAVINRINPISFLFLSHTFPFEIHNPKASRSTSVLKKHFRPFIYKIPETNIKMPLFGRHSEEETAPAVPEKEETPHRRSTLFGRHRSVSPVSTTTTQTNNSRSSLSRRGLLHRNDADPSIRAAHDRVLSAEAAEREADKALFNARAAVKEAREQVKRLEREAAEQ